ncbi:relaxase domain-containing protein [Escherichia coli]
MMSIAQVRSAGSAGNYYTDKDNYYVLGSMGERWAGRGAEQLGLQGRVDKDVFTRLLEGRLPDGADLSRMQDGSKLLTHVAHLTIDNQQRILLYLHL